MELDKARRHLRQAILLTDRRRVDLIHPCVIAVPQLPHTARQANVVQGKRACTAVEPE